MKTKDLLMHQDQWIVVSRNKSMGMGKGQEYYLVVPFRFNVDECLSRIQP